MCKYSFPSDCPGEIYKNKTAGELNMCCTQTEACIQQKKKAPKFTEASVFENMWRNLGTLLIDLF